MGNKKHCAGRNEKFGLRWLPFIKRLPEHENRGRYLQNIINNKGIVSDYDELYKEIRKE